MTDVLSHHRPPSVDQLLCDDGEPMETARHRQQMTVLIESLEHAWQGRDDFYVGGNMFLYFSETQAKKNDFRGPDVFVVMNTTRKERRAWVVWDEGGQAPDVVIELMSESTETVDRGERMRIYARALRVAEYFLFDPFSGVLEGYTLDPLRAEYVKKTPDADGRLECERVGLRLGVVPSSLSGVQAPWLRWLDERGHPLPVPSESAKRQAALARREAARAQVAVAMAEQAAARAEEEAAQARAERARAEAERTRAEAEAARAETEAARAEAEAARAEAEAARAERLEREIEALKRR